jgi:hypothetical protein
MLKPPLDLAADRLQVALTRRFLLPVLPALEGAFLAARAATDQAMALDASSRRGNRYPYGYCLEITTDVVQNLRARMASGRSAGARAVLAFLDNGGAVRMVWGALRGRYFQNAIQLGSLYVDVANDTVDVLKPKVEIMPMQDSGFVLIRDAAHFAEIAEPYWSIRIYANTALPSLAPLFPMVSVHGSGEIRLESRTDYMMQLFGSDGFQRSERWLTEGALLPQALSRALRAACPEDLLAANPHTGREAAIKACRRLRAERRVIDTAWIEQMCASQARIGAAHAFVRNTRPLVVSDMNRSNAHPRAGIGRVHPKENQRHIFFLNG